VEKNKLGLTIHLEKEQLMFRWKLKVTFFFEQFFVENVTIIMKYGNSGIFSPI
jgi:hypothetical protein